MMKWRHQRTQKSGPPSCCRLTRVRPSRPPPCSTGPPSQPPSHHLRTSWLLSCLRNEAVRITAMNWATLLLLSCCHHLLCFRSSHHHWLKNKRKSLIKFSCIICSCICIWVLSASKILLLSKRNCNIKYHRRRELALCSFLGKKYHLHQRQCN